MKVDKKLLFVKILHTQVTITPMPTPVAMLMLTESAPKSKYVAISPLMWVRGVEVGGWGIIGIINVSSVPSLFQEGSFMFSNGKTELTHTISIKQALNQPTENQTAFIFFLFLEENMLWVLIRSALPRHF